MRNPYDHSARTDCDVPSDDACRATVLCVDDDPEIPRTVGAYLANYGVNVLKAFHGTHGLELARTEQPDAILIDQHMPQGQGDTIIRCLKSDPETEGIPILVLTGRRGGNLQRRLFDLGVQCYLTKPVYLHELLDALRPFIAIREAPVGRTSIHESKYHRHSAEMRNEP